MEYYVKINRFVFLLILCGIFILVDYGVNSTDSNTDGEYLFS